MFIQDMIKKHNKCDYYLGIYNIAGSGAILTLLLKKNEKEYYDVRNHYQVVGSQVEAKKSLNAYANIDKQLITNKEAIQYAEGHYEEFRQELYAEGQEWSRIG